MLHISVNLSPHKPLDSIIIRTADNNPNMKILAPTLLSLACLTAVSPPSFAVVQKGISPSQFGASDTDATKLQSSPNGCVLPDGRDVCRGGKVPSGVAVLMYHHIGTGPAITTVSMDRLMAQLSFLDNNKSRFEVVDHERALDIVAALDAGAPSDPTVRAVLFTVDDGWKNAKIIADELNKRGWRGVLFMPSLVENSSCCLSAADLKAINSAGLVVENHSRSHSASKSMVGGSVLIADIEAAQRDLESATGSRPSLFAYPYGRATPRAREAAESLGFTALFGVAEGLWTSRLQNNLVPRYNVSGADPGFLHALGVSAHEVYGTGSTMIARQASQRDKRIPAYSQPEAKPQPVEPVASVATAPVQPPTPARTERVAIKPDLRDAQSHLMVQGITQRLAELAKLEGQAQPAVAAKANEPVEKAVLRQVVATAVVAKPSAPATQPAPTRADTSKVAQNSTPAPPRPALTKTAGTTQGSSKASAELAQLEVKLAQDLEAYHSLPRRKYVSAHTDERRFAQYVASWRQKLEQAGKLNVAQKGHEPLRMTVSIRDDGSVEQIEINSSSGFKTLDEAAKRMVRQGAPYTPFPSEIRKDTDVLSITHTWVLAS